MTIYFAKVSKKKNSTKVPTQSGTSLTNVRFKTPCSVMTPVLQLPYDYDQYNYMWYYDACREINRYYYLTDAVHLNNDIVECTYKEDYMATWATSIGTRTAYIARCSDTSIVDGLLSDTAYPAQNAVTLIRSTLQNVFTDNGGLYCVGLACSRITLPLCTRGSIQYVLMTLSDLVNLILGLQTLTASGATFSPFQYIVSCVYIPMTPQGESVDIHETIKFPLFNFPTGSTWKLDYHKYSEYQSDNGLSVELNTTMTIPTHPLASSRGEYLNFTPWLKSTLYTGVWGNIQIPLETISSRTSTVRNLGVKITVDYPTGAGRLQLFSGSASGGMCIYDNTAQLGIPIQLAQKTSADLSSLAGIATSAVGVVGSALVGNYAGAIGGAIGGVSSAIEALTPRVTTNGVNGSFANIAQTSFVLVSEYFTPCAENLDDKGRPVYSNHRINTIATGSYIQCADFHADFACNDTEREIIESTCINGFYWDT